MELIKVTIITVCYNSEKTIEQTIQSVLNQTYSNIEYIIVDGGSNDSTLDIIQKYDKRIKFISEKDDGIFHAMNKGIMKSSGDIIGILNSDDWYENETVELAVHYLSDEDCELIYGRCTMVYNDGTMIGWRPKKLESLRYKAAIMHPTVFVKRVLYEKYGIFNQHYAICADHDLMLRFYECGVKMKEIPHNMAYYRMSGISSINTKERMKEMKEIGLAHWDGKSKDVMERIEKCSEELRLYAELQEDMNGTQRISRDVLQEIFHKKRGYVIFGAGDYGIKCLCFLRNNSCIVENFIDNDSRKWGQECGGIEIKSPEYLKENDKNIIVANVYYKEEIGKQLEDIGYKYGYDYVLAEDILKAVSKVPILLDK